MHIVTFLGVDLTRAVVIVHHGGAGTTTAAARAGTPQIIIPHNYDQFYWAHRVQQLGAGASGPLRDDLTVDALDTLVHALRECLQPEVTTRAQALAGRMERASPQNDSRTNSVSGSTNGIIVFLMGFKSF
jgi:vancomycin aglycone glucosyltransferase